MAPMPQRLPAIRLAPTGAGWAFLLAVTALLLAAINYSNNVLYALAFFLAATGTNSAWSAWRAVCGLRIGALRAEAAFAGEPSQCKLQLTEAAHRERPAVRLGVGRIGEGAAAKIDADDHARLKIDVPTHRRGVLGIAGARIVSTWPFGLFRAWQPVPGEAVAMVYPAPERDGPIRHDGWRCAARTRNEAEAFSHFRDYAVGDAPARIHWPALAKSDALVTKIFDGAAGGTAVWLDWRDAVGNSPGNGQPAPADLTEGHLSRLCRWVLDANGGDLDFGLRLPGLEVAPGRGPVQCARCLEALATHKLATEAVPQKAKQFAWWGCS